MRIATFGKRTLLERLAQVALKKTVALMLKLKEEAVLVR
jgi:hypothetical protein